MLTWKIVGVSKVSVIYIYIYIYIDWLNHQWKGCRRTTYWTLPEAGSVKLKCQR